MQQAANRNDKTTSLNILKMNMETKTDMGQLTASMAIRLHLFLSWTASKKYKNVLMMHCLKAIRIDKRTALL